MANVYSQLLWQVASSIADGVHSGTVPTGFVWVVRSVCVTPPGMPWGVSQRWQLVDETGCQLAGEPYGFSIAGETQTTDMHHVLNGGGFLAFDGPGGGFSIRVSGYQLSLP